MLILLFAQASVGLLACSQAYTTQHQQRMADPVARERAAIIDEQLRASGHAVGVPSARSSTSDKKQTETVAACSRQYKAQFAEVVEWLDRGKAYLDRSEAGEALKQNSMAAEAGSPEGQWRVGYAYRYQGGGVEPDRAEAHRWFRKAAAAGHPQAALQLYQDLYPDGAPGAASVDGVTLLDTALAGRVPDAAYEMSLAVYLGARGTGDPVLAAAWMHLSARQGSEAGIDSLPEVLKPLNDAQREAALALSHKLQN